MSLNAMTLTTANAPAVAAFARLVGYSCTQLRTPTFTPTEPATAPAPALARALARVRLSPSTSTTTTTSITTTTSAPICSSSTSIKADSVIVNAAAAVPVNVNSTESTPPTIYSVTSSVVAAVDVICCAAKAACAFVVGKFAHVVSCCCPQLSLSTCWAKSALAQSKPSLPASGSPTTSPKTETIFKPTISRGAMAPIRSSASAIVSHHTSSSSSASATSTASSIDELSASSPISTAATTTTTTTSSLSNSTTATATTTTQLPSATPATAPTTAPSLPRRAWPAVRPWAGVADIERTTMTMASLSLPNAEASERSHRERLMGMIESQQEQERIWHAVDTEIHAQRAALQLVHTAVRQRDEPPHEDPPMYACCCGHCPNDTAAYALCAAATISSNLVQLSRVNRATASVASESLQRQNACFRRARCVFSPTRS